MAEPIKWRMPRGTEWDALTETDVKLLNANVICKAHAAGATLFMQDDPCRGLYLVESGLVAVRKLDEDGNSAVVRLAYPGDALGYRPLLAHENHRAGAEVIKDAHICFVDAKTMRALLANNPALGLSFLERTAKALGEAEERLFDVAALSVRVRLVHLLLLLRDRCGHIAADGTLVLNLPLTRRDLASMIGARPESVSRAFRDLQDDGLALASGRQIHLPQYSRLVEELHSSIAP